MQVSRYFILVVLNVFGWYLLGMVASQFKILDGVPDWLVFSVVASWGFPVAPLATFLELPDHSAIALPVMVSVPLCWAAMVEWMLRRFVDRPKDSDTA